MTARAGDAVILTSGGVKSREHIEAVELYRVFPATHNGQNPNLLNDRSALTGSKSHTGSAVSKSLFNPSLFS